MVSVEDSLVAITGSCTALLESLDDAWIDKDALASVVASHVPHRSSSCVRLPLKFDDLPQEVNYLALTHLLDQGSSHDVALLSSTGRTSRHCVEYGLMACHLDGRSLDARFLEQFPKQMVFTFFGVDACVEEEVRPGIMLSKQGPLAVWVNNVVSTLQLTGKAMIEAGQTSVGTWILSVLEGQASSGQPPSAGALVAELARTIPGFRDEWATPGLPPARFLRKAQGLAGTLAARFAATDPRFAFADLADLALDSGPATLHALMAAGVVRTSPDVAEALRARRDLGGSRQEAALRAAVVGAGRAAQALASDAGLPASAALGPALRLVGEAEEGRGQQDDIGWLTAPASTVY